ncbi:MAG: hypothetical protein AABY07_03550 [Nanoarchaeota archaeon]|mgnify:FL=1
MLKRGQSTAFIIIGMLIIIIAIIFSYFTGLQRGLIKETKRSIQLPEHIEAVRSYIDSCIEETVPIAVQLISLQGGYLNPINYLETDNIKINYGYKDKVKLIPSIKIIENEISKSIKEFLPLCLDFSKFPNLKIEQKEASSAVTIKENSIQTRISYLVEITKDDNKFILKNPFINEFPIRLGKIHNTLDSVIDYQIKRNNIDAVNLFLTGFDYSLIKYEDSIIISLADKQSKIKDKDFRFMISTI